MLFIYLLVYIIFNSNSKLIFNEIGYYRITSLISIFCAILTFNTYYWDSLDSGIAIFGGLFHITYFSQLLETFLFVIAGIIFIAWPLFSNKNYISGLLNKNLDITNKYLYIKRFNSHITNYSLIVIFNLLGASLLISSLDLISVYLSIELQSFALYVISTLFTNSQYSTSAGLKYFLLGGLSSCFILFGSALIYSFLGLTNIESLYGIISSSIFNPIYYGFFFGLIAIYVGLLFKISAAPLHNWAPDVYEDTPTIVTIWLTLIPKISILILLVELFLGFNFDYNFNIIDNYNLNLFNLSNFNINFFTQNVLLLSSFLSLIIGSVVGLAQLRLKRLLSYSTINHIGFILLALAITSQKSLESFTFYFTQYIFTNLNVFLIIIIISYFVKEMITYTIIKNESNNISKFESKPIILENLYFKDIKYISELKSLFFSNPLIAISFSICLFSMAGIPPLMGFFSKYYVLFSVVQKNLIFLSFICIIVSVISAYYYLKVISFIYSRGAGASAKLPFELSNLKIFPIEFEIKIFNNSHPYLIAIFTLFILFCYLKNKINTSS